MGLLVAKFGVSGGKFINCLRFNLWQNLGLLVAKTRIAIIVIKKNQNHNILCEILLVAKFRVTGGKFVNRSEHAENNNCVHAHSLESNWWQNLGFLVAKTRIERTGQEKK